MKHDILFLATILSLMALFYMVGSIAPRAQSRPHARNTLQIDCVVVHEVGGDVAKCSDGVGYPVSHE